MICEDRDIWASALITDWESSIANSLGRRYIEYTIGFIFRSICHFKAHTDVLLYSGRVVAKLSINALYGLPGAI